MRICTIRLTILFLLAIAFVENVGHASPPHKPARVEEYKIHEDGGLVCDPLRREAEKTGQLSRYSSARVRTETAVNGPYTLTTKVPAKAVAYDVIPIRYSLRWEKGASFPFAVEAVAFEEIQRRGDSSPYDLALPGKIDLGIKYLGSITAHLVPELKHNIKADFSDTPKEYPNFQRQPMVRPVPKSYSNPAKINAHSQTGLKMSPLRSHQNSQ